MDIIKNSLEDFVSGLEQLQKIYIKELSNCPPGSLINNNLHGKPAYYHAITQKDGNYKRTRLDIDSPLINKLARKDYLTRLLQPLQNNLLILQKALKNYKSMDPADIISMTSRACHLLPNQSFFGKQINNALWDVIPNLEEVTDDMIKERCKAHWEWANDEYEKNTYPHVQAHFTQFGLRTRSRGETMIAERLHYYGVPFRHDQIIVLDNGIVESPDFSFEDKYFDEFYWEYCGMMDDYNYVRDHLRKRSNYERNGIVPWRNIHFTYSTDNGFDLREIDSIILYWIIPKL